MRTSELSMLPFAAPWLTRSGPDDDVALATRVRLARNIAGVPFPHAAGPDDRELVVESVLAAVREELRPEPFGADALDLAPGELSPDDRNLLAERSLVDGSVPTRLVVAGDESVSLQIDAVDHLRIVTLAAGRAGEAALERAREIDRALEKRLNYAVAMDWGYLSSEITNLGTAMRASTLVHVPALATTGRIEAMSASMANSGYELVPWFSDEASDRSSALHLLRNRRTLGSDEDAIVSKLEDYASKLVHYERAARDELSATRGGEIADSANRALGILRFARSLSAVEARSLVSHLRLGVVAGLVTDVAVETVTTLLLINQDSHMARGRAREGDEGDIDAVRAGVFRKLLATDRA